MKIIPCQSDPEFQSKVKSYAEALRMNAHMIGDHGLSEDEFYESGVFIAAIERIRGQFSATTREKRDFVNRVLSHMQDLKLVKDFEEAGGSNRHDFLVFMPSGKKVVIELKGCLDGNNTNIFERPPHAEEFIIWSICTNPGADPEKNVKSGLHTRLSAEIISKEQVVDGVVVWDMVCGTIGRPCPKITAVECDTTALGPFRLPPPCLYVFPATIPSPRNNPTPKAQRLEAVEILSALAYGFGERRENINFVDLEVRYSNVETIRSTVIRSSTRDTVRLGPTPIQRL